MDKVQKKVPNLRFKGFNDNWEQHKFGEEINQYERKTETNNQYPVLTSSRKGIFFQKDYYDGHQIASKDNTGYNIVPRGYFTYRHMSDDNIFRFNINDLVDNGIVSTLYPVFSVKDISSDKNFVYYYLNYGNEMKKFALIQKQGGSRTYMYLSKLQNLDFVAPPKKEQEKIGKILNNLDNTITLHQRKLDLLQQLKKGLLQKMFADKDQKQPGLRFEGFNDAWEQRKLGKIADVRDGTHDSPRYVNDGYMLLTSKNVGNGYINYDDAKYISEKDYIQINKRSKVDVNDILMGMIGTIGNLALIRKEPNFAIKNVALIKHTINFNHQFLFQELQTSSILKELLSSMDGGTQKFISLKKIRDLGVLLPSKDEQSQISSFLDRFDSLITLHQRKLDRLNKLKKGLLQQMFI